MAVLGAVLSVIGWILLGILCLVLLLLILPIGARVDYRETWNIRVLLFGFLPVFTMSGDQAAKKEAAPPNKEEEQPPAQPAVTDTPKKPSLIEELKLFYRQEGLTGILAFFKQLLRIATGTLKTAVRFITVRELSLCISVGGKEADETAVRYGQICTALFPILSALSCVLRFRRREVLVRPDFTSDALGIRMKTVIWVWPFGIVYAALAALVKLIIAWMPIADAAPDGTTSSQTQTEQQTV